jgi:hypothetical protein
MSLRVIEQWQRLARSEPDARRRANYAGLALVFAELTDCRPVWKQALEGWNVEQSLQVLEWQAQTKADDLLRVLGKLFGSCLQTHCHAELRTSLRNRSSPAKNCPEPFRS